jgi:hypothetical protein
VVIAPARGADVDCHSYPKPTGGPWALSAGVERDHAVDIAGEATFLFACPTAPVPGLYARPRSTTQTGDRSTGFSAWAEPISAGLSAGGPGKPRESRTSGLTSGTATAQIVILAVVVVLVSLGLAMYRAMRLACALPLWPLPVQVQFAAPAAGWRSFFLGVRQPGPFSLRRSSLLRFSHMGALPLAPGAMRPSDTRRGGSP